MGVPDQHVASMYEHSGTRIYLARGEFQKVVGGGGGLETWISNGTEAPSTVEQDL